MADRYLLSKQLIEGSIASDDQARSFKESADVVEFGYTDTQNGCELKGYRNTKTGVVLVTNCRPRSGSDSFCELCRQKPVPFIGCHCSSLQQRIETLMPILDELKQHGVAVQEFDVAGQIRDALKCLSWAIYKLRCGDERNDPVN